MLDEMIKELFGDNAATHHRFRKTYEIHFKAPTAVKVVSGISSCDGENWKYLKDAFTFPSFLMC